MKSKFYSRQAKVWVDILMVVLFLACAIGSSTQMMGSNYWKSSHCILGIIWVVLMIIHMIQHWPMIQVLLKKRVMTKNKVTALTCLAFILMVISIISFIPGTSFFSLHFHFIFGRLFILILIVHTIQKFKWFIGLTKTTRKTTDLSAVPVKSLQDSGER